MTCRYSSTIRATLSTSLSSRDGKRSRVARSDPLTVPAASSSSFFWARIAMS